MIKKKVGIIIGLVLIVSVVLFLMNRWFFNAPQFQEEKFVFIVNEHISKKL